MLKKRHVEEEARQRHPRMKPTGSHAQLHVEWVAWLQARRQRCEVDEPDNRPAALLHCLVVMRKIGTVRGVIPLLVKADTKKKRPVASIGESIRGPEVRAAKGPCST